MAHNLARRVARLEACLGAGKQTYRRLAERLNVDLERLLKAVRGRESELAPQLGQDGGITWEGYLLVLKLLGITPSRAANIRPADSERIAGPRHGP